MPKGFSRNREKKSIKGSSGCNHRKVSAKEASGTAPSPVPGATVSVFKVCRDRWSLRLPPGLEAPVTTPIGVNFLVFSFRDRWRVDSCGKACSDSKTFHLVIARGSQAGQRHILEGEGDETLDTLPGDLVFVLQQKPHARFRRSGVSPSLAVTGLSALTSSSSWCGCPLARAAQHNCLKGV